MFIVDDMTISMSIGDTGAIRIQTSGYDFDDDDRAIFTIKSGNGTVLMEREYQIDENGGFLVCFYNSNTEQFSAGNYQWDVRFVLEPYRDSDGKIMDGAQILTPYGPQTFTLMNTVGTV